MSRRANQLAKYRSYSYYHVLAVCDSSQTASNLAAMTSLDVWQHAIGNPDTMPTDGDFIPLGKYDVKTLGGDTPGRYCVLINGATDAAFTITKANWTSYTAAAATMYDRNTSIALEGSLSISEPRGIMFLDQVVRCCLALGVDSANTFWVLKTFFVGYTYDSEQGDNVEYINDIPPIIFLAYDVTGNFGNVGGEYEINFVAAANSAARLPQFSKSVKALNIKAGNTLEATLKELETEINRNYEKYFQCVYDQVKSIPNGGEELAKNLRKVTYEISCGDPYAGNDLYDVSDQAPQLKDEGHDCAAPANVHISSGISIEDAIHRILGMSTTVKNEASIGVGDRKFIAKIHSWVKSEIVDNSTGELKFTVGYRVERQEQPRSVVFEDFATTADISPSENPNVIEFDYLYTGKNIDIIEFDIKMNMGMVYLQGMTIANPYRSPGKSIPIIGSAISEQGLARFNGTNIPVFFGTQIKTAGIKDTQNIPTTAQHAYSMAKHASLEMLEASVKIMGNTQLLGSVNNTTDPDLVERRVTSIDKDDGFARFSEWTLSPAFAKINIKMPRNNDDKSLFTGTQTGTDNTTGSNDYAVDFWFQGYYYVYGIEHVFDNGEFYQVLSALSIPESNSFRTTKNAVAERDAKLDKMIQSCYEDKVGCGSQGTFTGSAKSSVGLPESYAGTETPEAKTEAFIYTPSDENLHNIEGYDKAPNEVKVAIHNAAVNNPPIKEYDLALMISYESGFRPGIVNKYGYKGLGQFGDSTWRQFGHGSPLDPNANADATAKYMLHNRKIYQKTFPNDEPNVVDLYTMHQQGSGGGMRILRNVKTGNGGASAGLSDKNIRANRLPSGRSDDVYASMAKNLGRRLKKGTMLARREPDPLTASLPKAGTDPIAAVLPVTTPPEGVISEAFSYRPRLTAKDNLAAATSCSDIEKQQTDTTKSSCSNTPTEKASETDTTSTVNPTPTGQAESKTESVVVLKKDPIMNVFPLT